MPEPAVRHRLRPLTAALLLPLAAAAAPDLIAPRWVLIPQVDVAATRDSNVYRTPDQERDDLFIEPELSLRYASSTETNRWHLRAAGFVAGRAYADEDTQDFETFGQEVELCYGGDGPARLALLQGFRRVEDLDRHTPDSAYIRRTPELLQDINSQSARRDLLDVGVALEQRLTDKSDALFVYQFDAVDYDQAGLLDLLGHLAQAELAHQLTDRSDLYTDLRYAWQEQTDGPGSAEVIKGRVGLRSRRSDALLGKVGLGLQRYAWDGVAGDDAEESVSVDLALDWQASDKTKVYGGLNNGSQLSSLYEQNALDFITTWIGLTHAWTTCTTLGLRASYRRDEYLDPVADGDQQRTRRDQRYQLAARADYRAPSRPWGVYAQVAQEYVVSTLDSVEYDDNRLTLGAQVAY